MGRCKYYDVCRLDDPGQPDGHLCILHSQDPAKSTTSFRQELTNHLNNKDISNKFDRMVFPCEVSFSDHIFDDGANFLSTHFLKEVNFDRARFSKFARFTYSVFEEEVNFEEASFGGVAWFTNAQFKADADFNFTDFSGRSYFRNAKFKGFAWFTGSSFESVYFHGTEFQSSANFSGASFAKNVIFKDLIFSAEADFSGAHCEGKVVFQNLGITGGAKFWGIRFAGEAEFNDVLFKSDTDFSQARCVSPVVFTSGSANKIFLQDANFEQVRIATEALTFIGTDLTKCRFLGSDAKNARFIGVQWPRKGNRDCVYDEIVRGKQELQLAWVQLEELYRQLKQNYEERRDYGRAGDFHMGEKEMRLKNPTTRLTLKCLLLLYKWISGYGEKYLRPVFWLAVLFLVTTATALVGGVQVVRGMGAIVLSVEHLSHWGWAILYAVDTIFHLPSKEFNPTGIARAVYSIASILGPVLLALFGLALRQHLRR